MSAWRNLGDFGRRSSPRTWLTKIANHRYLSVLRRESRRPRIAAPPPKAATVPEAPLLEPAGAADAPPWLEPHPDVMLDVLGDQSPGPEPRYGSAEATSLTFITALQLLPPQQRAALVLCDVLGYHPSEAARMLDTTPEAVHRALKHARVTVDTRLADSNGSSTDNRSPARRPDAAAEHRLVARFTDAVESADVDALIGLLVSDVRLSMPPAMLEYRGIASAQRILAATFHPGRTYRVIPTRANGQPAFGMYLADPHASVHRAYCLLVLTTAGDHITAITAFSTNVMPRFGLPRIVPETETD